MGSPTAACVFDIQRFSLHDGPGIRTLVFLKGCPLSCRWCCNPESQGALPELGYFAERCIGCGSCFAACPYDAVTMTDGRPQFARTICNTCQDKPCVGDCPSRALQIFGQFMSVDTVLERVLQDELFYRTSGGGVTVSGGEPLAHAPFVAAFLGQCTTLGIPTGIETSGHATWDRLETLLPVTNLFLFDLKHPDATHHREWTGVTNTQILENLTKLGTRGAQVVVRVPIVPGFNDSDETIARLAVMAHAAGVQELHLLPYHRLGRAKYDALALQYPMQHGAVPSAVQMHRLRTVVEEHGLRVVLGG